MNLVTIDAKKCQGHALCVALMPSVFQVDDSGMGYVAVATVPTEYRADLDEAILACPERAIKSSA